MRVPCYNYSIIYPQNPILIVKAPILASKASATKANGKGERATGHMVSTTRAVSTDEHNKNTTQRATGFRAHRNRSAPEWITLNRVRPCGVVLLNPKPSDLHNPKLQKVSLYGTPTLKYPEVNVLNSNPDKAFKPQKPETLKS